MLFSWPEENIKRAENLTFTFKLSYLYSSLCICKGTTTLKRSSNGHTDEKMQKQFDRQTDQPTDRLSDGYTGRWTHKQTDRLTNKLYLVVNQELLSR